ncbi:putative methyltransferase DDB_G0268948 [Denticeps clupeoides]|uniref:Methyltransferase type 11 domain-containing protein n=1 Tax=Denticeps clupeoides TaxID=299321 RepID=A0AAY4AYW1_9TELE|nr:putative methyltransferase DDB_G0268948 [Denticeps clupeoides]XP_028841069.1 putative methyltransferase DDB_G0268948 [Denticeps clupeoides]XP_028841070.1 putative methyltransferase DDB_G0268948 [Denticeps clupeoides]
MTHRMFEEKHHASIYQKYRFVPPDEVKEVILQYLDKKKGQPHVLAVDLGCGTGQNSRIFAPYFEEVVGIDVSENQLQEARAVPGFPNLTYRAGTAERLPFPDASVDLLTAASAAHWFDPERFLQEANRVLKPRGCMALLGFIDPFVFPHQSWGDRLNQIYAESRKALLPYASSRVAVADGKLQELYDAITFPEKERVEVQVRQLFSVKRIVGFMESLSMYQVYHKAEPQAAVALLKNTTERIMKEIGASSTDIEIEVEMEYFCILACKPQCE